MGFGVRSLLMAAVRSEKLYRLRRRVGSGSGALGLRLGSKVSVYASVFRMHDLRFTLTLQNLLFCRVPTNSY